MPRPSNRRASHVPGGGVIRALALVVAGSILLAGTPVAWAQTPKTVGKEAAASVGATGSWSRYKTSYAAKNEAPNQSWYNLAWDTKRNLAYGIAWDGVLAAFDPVAGRWNNVSDIGETNDFHNRTIGYDFLYLRDWGT